MGLKEAKYLVDSVEQTGEPFFLRETDSEEAMDHWMGELNFANIGYFVERDNVRNVIVTIGMETVVREDSPERTSLAIAKQVKDFLDNADDGNVLEIVITLPMNEFSGQ